MAPTVSVVLNCYDHEAYVGEAIESVLNQTFSDFELILIDNGSTDGSRAVLKRYDDPRIRRAFHDENVSLSRRLNEGVAIAAGQFVAILYSDDYMLPDKLERQVALFRELPDDYGVVYCPALGFNQLTGERWEHSSMTVSGTMLPALFRRHFEGAVDMSSPLTRQECFERYRWHDDLFTDGESVFFRIAQRWKFHFDLHPTIVMRDHGGNLGKALQRNHDLLMTMLDRLEVDPDFHRDWLDDLYCFRAAACRNNAWAALRSGGDTAWARRQLARALRLEPSRLLHPRMLAALALAKVPEALRSPLNKLGHRLRQRPGNRNLVQDYQSTMLKLP